MKLFRRILFSLLPDEMVQHETNPAGMFLSFVDPKRFFSVICRKIVENYKLNLFDIWLDSFEAKVWLGDEPYLKPKEINDYYAYATVANVNGWSFYSPANIGTALTLLVSVYIKSVFKQRHRSEFYNFLVTVNILCFAFASRIKVFPLESTNPDSEEQNYQRFVAVFFNFYRLTLDAGKKKISDSNFENLKKELLQHIHVFFLLYRVYKKLNMMFYVHAQKQQDFYDWIFSDYSKKSPHKAKIQDFVQQAQVYTRLSRFADLDEDLIKLLLPTDMMIKYIFHHQYLYEVVDRITTEIYPPAQMDDLVMSFLKNDHRLDELLQELFAYERYKTAYFPAMKEFVAHTYRLWQWYKQQKEIDSFISSIESKHANPGSDSDMPDMPDALKDESMMTERFVNFYITFLAGLRVGKWDNFYLRLFHKSFVTDITNIAQTDELSQQSLMYYGGLLYQYSKNIFYYKYANEHIRKGIDQFSLPTKPTTKEVYSNMYILKLFDEYFVATCFQDINKKNLTLTISNKKIISLFKSQVWDRISKLIQLDQNEYFVAVYSNVLYLVPDVTQVIDAHAEHIAQNFLPALKQNLYTLDLRLRQDYLWLLKEHEVSLEWYASLCKMWICASLRETILGVLLVMTYLELSQAQDEVFLHIDTYVMIYLQDVILLSSEYLLVCKDLLYDIQHQYAPLLEYRLSLDDNTQYLELGKRNRINFVKDKSEQQIIESVAGEDVVRLRWYLKNISTYNKRYVIPQ